MLVVERPWEVLAAPSPLTWPALVGLALFSTALSYVLYFRVLAAAGPTDLLLVTLLIPITAILPGALFLGERLQLRELAGMLLTGCALALLDGRVLRIPRPAK